MTLLDQIREWDSSTLDKPVYDYNHNFSNIYEVLDYWKDKFFHQFIPTKGHDHPEFLDRLENWLENVSDVKDKKILFEFTLKIHFISEDDKMSMFISAFSGPIKRWIIDLHSINLGENIDKELNLHLLNKKTWYCSITDMGIDGFYKINGIRGIKVRSDLNALAEMRNEEEIKKYIFRNGFEQIVLLEDFVGSGKQFTGILKKCSNCFGNMPILFVPLLICSNGKENISKILEDHKNWSFEPVIEISESERLTPKTDLSEDHLQRRVVNIAKCFSQQKNRPTVEDPVYGFENTGALIVLHSNTPNNTMPFIWWAEKWNALFPRSPRI